MCHRLSFSDHPQHSRAQKSLPRPPKKKTQNEADKFSLFIYNKYSMSGILFSQFFEMMPSALANRRSHLIHPSCEWPRR